MIGSASQAQTWAAVIISLAVLVAIVRLLAWQRSAQADARSPRPRMALLLLLQPMAGLLLYLTLFPPGITASTGMLIVATRGTPASIERGPADVLVSLPETADLPGAIRVPDLATALRRFPGVARIRVEGEGLVPRDRLTQPAALEFDPPPPPVGLIDLALPDPVAPGAVFEVGGQVGALPAGLVELVDPAGRVVDRARVTAGGRFVLKADTRTQGLALFQLRLRNLAGDVVERITVPVHVRVEAQPRVGVLAGAPDAETKYLRRWAGDAGIALTIDIDVGAGVRLGDAPVPLTRTALGRFDLIVVDDRRWESIGDGGRAALRGAVADGLGLLLRPTGPLTQQTRRDWAALGLPLTGGADVVPLRIDPPANGLNTDNASTSTPDPLPPLARRDLVGSGPNAVSLLSDADGSPLASWRSRGRGRVGLWTVTDSYVLVLAGRSDRHSELWSDLFSALARSGDEGAARIYSPAINGTRTSVCRLSGRASVLTPGGGRRALLIDPATEEQGCSAFWPTHTGWHVVRDGEGRETPFYVHSTASMRSLEIWTIRQETFARVTAQPDDTLKGAATTGPGSPWLWFAALLCVLALLWAMERRRPTTSFFGSSWLSR